MGVTTDGQPHDKWIGVAEVRGRPGNGRIEPGVEGAFVVVVALAMSATDFEHQVMRALAGLKLELVTIEDPELLSQRVATRKVDDDVLALADGLSRTRRVAFYEFCIFPEGTE
jgi:hypothetical protein